MSYLEPLTRAEQVPGTQYVCPDGQAFVSPDGVGRHYYDSHEDLLEEHGTGSVVFLDEFPEDW